MSEIFIVKGTSGSGKSTRTTHLVNFLKSKFEITDFIFKGIPIGLYWKEKNILFLGKICKNKVWRSFDDFDYYFTGIAEFCDYTCEHRNELSMFIEGSGVVITNRLRPNYLHEVMGIDNLFIQYYCFDTVENFSNRKFLRNGKRAENGWGKNDSFNKEFEKCRAESLEGDLILLDNFDVPVYDLGYKFLNLIGSDLGDEFVNYCKLNF